MTSHPEAVSTLCAAASYLMELYYSAERRRNGGWGDNVSQREAYHLLLRLAREVREL